MSETTYQTAWRQVRGCLDIRNRNTTRDITSP